MLHPKTCLLHQPSTNLTTSLHLFYRNPRPRLEQLEGSSQSPAQKAVDKCSISLARRWSIRTAPSRCTTARPTPTARCTWVRALISGVFCCDSAVSLRCKIAKGPGRFSEIGSTGSYFGRCNQKRIMKRLLRRDLKCWLCLHGITWYIFT